MVNILLFAYSAVGNACLECLINANEPPVAVITYKDNPQETIWFPSVAGLAMAHGIPILTPDNPNDPGLIENLRSLKPDLLLSAYYRHILYEEILELPRLGAFNLHGSLLPKYRGRCPVNWAIIQGESETGVTLHHMVKMADAGDIVDQVAFPIGPNDTAGKVMENISKASTKLLLRQLDALKAGTAPHQPFKVLPGSYFGGRTPKDAIIDWQVPPQVIHNLIRSQLPYPQFPGATTTYKDKPLRILGSLVVDQSPSVIASEAKQSSILEVAPGLRSEARNDDSELVIPEKFLPGKIMSLQPLYVAAQDNSTVLEITDYQWIDSPEQLEVGGVFGV